MLICPGNSRCPKFSLLPVLIFSPKEAFILLSSDLSLVDESINNSEFYNLILGIQVFATEVAVSETNREEFRNGIGTALRLASQISLCL